MSEGIAFPGLDRFPDIVSALDLVEKRMVEATRVDDPVHSEITAYLAKAGGKRVRPLLALLGARLGGVIAETAIEAGVAVELIHLGSLHHDDVIDESPTRRGRRSVNANWGNSVAILAGDLVLARASEIGARLGRRASELLARTLGTIVYGQMLELSRAYDLESDVEGYLEIIEKKTASLISTSIALGGMTAGLEDSDVETLAEYGRLMGIVFQVADDVLDVVGSSDRLGKPVGLDMIEGTYTLPVIYGLRSDRSEELAGILRRIKELKMTEGLVADDGDSGARYAVSDEIASAISRACKLLVDTGSVGASLDFAQDRAQAAKALLARFEESPVVELLEGVGEMILGRLPKELVS